MLINRSIKVMSIIILIILLIYICFIIIFNFNNNEHNKARVEIYFLNPLVNTLEAESKYIDKSENEIMTQEVLKMLYEGPKNGSLSKTFPDYVKFLDGRLVIGTSPNDVTLEVEFSSEYKDMSKTEELFFRGSLVWTMTSLDFIKDVHIFVEGDELLKANGQPMGLLNRKNVLLNPVISPSKLDSQKVKLYFISSSKQKLVPEEQTIQYNPDRPIENYIVEMLIAGPRNSNLTPTVPSETRLRGDVKTDEGICYVNLSNDFVLKNTASDETLKLSIYSVVNSLTELSNIKKVQFLIEAEKIENFKGIMDLSKPIERNEEFIINDDL